MTHYNATYRVIRYLKHNPGRGFLFPRNSDIQILGYFNSDLARCINSRKSISVYCFFLCSSLISWSAKKKQTISRSSFEVEYRALSIATCELQWLLHLFRDLQVTHTRPSILYCDSQSEIHISKRKGLTWSS